MERITVRTGKAPAAIGPYAQANIAGGFIFTSGQIPLDPASGEMVGTTIEEQAPRAFENLRAVLEAGGASLGDVVKTTVYLKDMGHFSKVNEIYAGYFGGAMLPSRSAVEVSRLPKDALIEIEAIAAVSMV